jgi:hypothetical protein
MKRSSILCVPLLILGMNVFVLYNNAAAQQASADDRCRLMDPTGTRLNVRTAPGGQIIEAVSNGTLVTILDRSFVSGRKWVYVGRYENRVPIGWVYRDYLNCNATATTQPSLYVVDGLALGGMVRFESEAYKEYHCSPSDKFSGFTWCHKEKTERTTRGEVSLQQTRSCIVRMEQRYTSIAMLNPHSSVQMMS